MVKLPAHAQAFLAPAKLNLDLRITGRRADGYHLLESIFCLIDLCDIVHLAPRTDAEVILHAPAASVAAEQDLSYRAAKALQQAANCRLGADIWLQKNIPMGGGLGGGSSDAATVLLALTIGATVADVMASEDSPASAAYESPYRVRLPWPDDELVPDLLDGQQEHVAIAVGADRTHFLHMPGLLALAPQFATRT